MVFSKSLREGAQALHEQKTTLCLHHKYFADSKKFPYATCWKDVNKRRRIFLHLDTVLKNSTPGKWAYIIIRQAELSFTFLLNSYPLRLDFPT